uniref:SET domain-containing protein n=1 Tax=viral metagenome TaxID=1070528 RepID=A0A6C0HJF2_9ZZZZ
MYDSVKYLCIESIGLCSCLLENLRRDMPFGSGSANVSCKRVTKAARKKKWNTKSEMNHQILLVIKETKYVNDLETGYGLYAPGSWPPSPRYSAKTGCIIPSKKKRKVVILKGDIVTGYAGFFASNKDKNTSQTHTAPAGNLGHADGKKIRDLVVGRLRDTESSTLDIIGSPKFNLAPKNSKFHVSWDMLGVFLNSSYGLGAEATNVSSPCQKEATTFFIGSNDVEGRVRVSPRFQNVLPDSFIMMPMFATRDIYEGEELFWSYPWRA